jgi:hypothetical protein
MLVFTNQWKADDQILSSNVPRSLLKRKESQEGYIVSIFLARSQHSWEIEVGQPHPNKACGLFKRCGGLKQIAITGAAPALVASLGSLCPANRRELGSFTGACAMRRSDQSWLLH